MKVTDQVIIDLFPLYQAGEASEDTELLIKDYLQLHPEFAADLNELSTLELTQDLPEILTPEDEMFTLNKTKRLLKLRSVLFGAGIFFSSIPFAFGDVSFDDEAGVRWLWSDFPEGAIAVGIVGLLCWGSYFYLRNQLSATSL